MKVLVLGATGLTGGLVLRGLLAAGQVQQVITPVRRFLAVEHDKLHQEIVDFDHLEQHQSLFCADAVICCLGSTIRKAGSRSRFRQIDYGYPMKAAELSREQGVEAFLLMSAIDASSSSPVFYNRVKGELEDALCGLGFLYLSIYQPGLLMTERSEQRFAEAAGIRAMPAINCLLQGPMRRYRGIGAEVVASAMVNEVIGLTEKPTTSQASTIYRHYDDMVALSSSR